MDPGLYCYKVMPFGLKNVRVTHQCLANKVFEPLIEKVIEVYVHDMTVKSAQAEGHAIDLQHTFYVLYKYDMKLNPEKRIFGVKSGKFLGFMINNLSIETNLDKVQAVFDMKPPWNVKEV